jgi:hypothetical protein
MGVVDVADSTFRAVCRGGPAGGRVLTVQGAAGYPPRFIGVSGGNYVHPGERPSDESGRVGALVYDWVPAGTDVRAVVRTG